MHKMLYALLCLGSALSLSACQDKELSYLDLMTNPEQLQTLYNSCVEEVSSPELPCDLISHADADFTALVDRHEQDPEEFGRQIIAAQQSLPDLKASVDRVWQAYQKLGEEKASVDTMKDARAEVDKAEAAYKLMQEKIQILLTVVVTTSSLG